MLWNEPFSLLNSELRLIYRLNYWIKLKLLNKAQLRKTPPDSRSLSCEHGARVLESNSDACSVLVFLPASVLPFVSFPISYWSNPCSFQTDVQITGNHQSLSLRSLAVQPVKYSCFFNCVFVAVAISVLICHCLNPPRCWSWEGLCSAECQLCFLQGPSCTAGGNTLCGLQGKARMGKTVGLGGQMQVGATSCL